MTSVTLANQHFTLGLTMEDQFRRDGYFRDPSNPLFSLSEDERGILDALGIDATMENSMRPYLPKFFMALPGCQTDTTMMLSKSCEIPYYVLWSTHFGARQAAKTRFDANKKETCAQTNMEMAESSAMIGSLKSAPAIYDPVHAIFTLIPLTPLNSAPAKRNVIPSTRSAPRTSMIERVFTLIRV